MNTRVAPLCRSEGISGERPSTSLESSEQSCEAVCWSETTYATECTATTTRSLELQTIGTTSGAGGFGEAKTYVVQTARDVVDRCVLMTTDPWRLSARSYLWIWHYLLRCRTMGPPLDHNRHLPSSAGTRPCPHHGRALPVLPARRQSGGTAQGGRDHAQSAFGGADARRRPAGVRLRAGAAHHAQVDRQQRRDRRHLGALAGDAGAAARRPERQTRWRLGGVADSPRGVRRLAGRGSGDASTVVGGAHHPAAGDRRLPSRPGPTTEYLYDKPYEDGRKVRVAGPFTVESLSPHRVFGGRRARRAHRFAPPSRGPTTGRGRTSRA